MPGRAALRAATPSGRPPTRSISSPRGGGRHTFSDTLDAHNRAVTPAGAEEQRMSGLFISFEGIDGAGKSTHIARLHAASAARAASTSA
jgi:hypothetical protein